MNVPRITAVVLIACVCPAESAISEDYRVELTIDQRVATNGQLRYSLRAVFSRDDVLNKLAAPNGTQFTYQNQYVENLTFGQLTSTAFGNWRAQTESSNVQFALQSFGLDDVASEIPIITSPLSGSKVPLEFDITWQSEADGFVNILKRSSNIGRTSGVNPIGCCLHTLTTELKDGKPGSLEIEVFTRTILPPPTLLNSPPIVDTFTFQAHFRSHSATASYVVVPEPSTSLLLTIGALAIGRRRSGWASPSGHWKN